MRPHIIVISLLSIFISTSCASRKDVIYLQDQQLEEGQLSTEPTELKYKPDDILTINVSALDPDTVRPFNLPVVSNNTFDITSAQGTMQQQSYLVDYNGNIEFPVLGTIKVEGLTRTELTSLLVDKIKVMANDPIVNIRLANFTITVIGEVNRPGTFTMQDERVTLLEALGYANDLTIFGRRKNVKLIREIDGKKKFAYIDLTSINTVNSHLYYLQQNDVIYVEPNRAKIRSSSYNQNNGVIISAISTLATITAIVLSNQK
ncbi:polysaccharide biosynthesis/export family protein [Winogradskyella litoriviva]|uniref:Polysaccharide biosynthesis/export family protein n=1 Tax=Winogradskyella litoriviva TaxID=1220182 RepID=A0ABX2E5G9_9FLAO|nr:polysaccharide biosynthesis/export family protein [Winogradskyella litoriviva]NRD23515.1 polysaccharide biosynthesis/export family protein [Winogradskyella litoriviva]